MTADATVKATIDELHENDYFAEFDTGKPTQRVLRYIVTTTLVKIEPRYFATEEDAKQYVRNLFQTKFFDVIFVHFRQGELLCCTAEDSTVTAEFLLSLKEEAQ